MELLGAIALYFLFKFLYGLWKRNQEEQKRMQTEDVNKHLYDQAVEQMQEEREKNMENNNKGTRDLFLETLTKIGCQYELPEEEGDNRIFFAYQGEHFFVIATNEAKLIQIYDTHWGHVELYDIDEFARLKKVINGSNMNNNVTTVYTIDEAGSNVDVHCKFCLLFVPQIPDIEDYLRWALNEFFRVHQHVGNELVKLREKEESNA